MTIDRLGPIDPISRYERTGKTPKVEKKEGGDSVAFSEEGKMKAELFKAVENVRNSPDVRVDRVAEVKRKLQDPNYINNKVIESVAERLMDAFDI